MLDTSNQQPEIKKLINTVVDGGYCIGCGACASVSESSIQMKLDKYGQFQATLESLDKPLQTNIPTQAVCPFSDKSLNEDEIGKELFAKDCEYHNKIGYYLSTYAGYVTEGSYRDKGSSGGMGTWIVSELLRLGLVDGVIHVHQRVPSDEDSRLFHYKLSTTLEQVCNGAKSRYYPIEMSEVLKLVREQPGRYAIVGIPCFIKAIRLLMKQDSVISERIQFCVGLVCGHLKSLKFAEMFAWQCGIEPGSVLSFDFRKKLPGANANQYGIEVTGLVEGEVVTKISPVSELYGRDWGLGFFKYKACDYCDDVLAETADVVVGDAWLPQYIKDSQGTNVIVVRHPIIHRLLKDGVAQGKVHLDNIDADTVAQSQSSGLNHRREGLAYRLHLADSKGEWRPQKRIQPSAKHLNSNLQQRQIVRIKLAQESHLAFKEAVDDRLFSSFVQKMEPLVRQYKALYQTSSQPSLSLSGHFKQRTRQFLAYIRSVLGYR